MSSSIAPSISPFPLFRRADSTERGRHLVATAAIPKGTLIFAERPLVALQSLDNQREVKVCHCCKAFLGGPDYALLKRFETVPVDESGQQQQQEGETPSSPDTDAMNNEDFTVVPCRHGCGHAYCSKECEQDAWQGFHQDLCTGLCESAEDPIVKFKLYATETNEILLMVAEWWVAQHRCSDEYRARYTDFSMPDWWDVAITSSLDQVGGFAEGVLIQESLKEICQHAADLLNKALLAAGNGIPLISDADVSQWIGACEQNSMGIRQRHALCRSVLEDDNVRRRRHQEIVRCLTEAGFLGYDEDDSENEEEGGNVTERRQEFQYENENSTKKEEGNGEKDAEMQEEVARATGETNDSACKNENNTDGTNDEWDYSVNEIEMYLAGLFIDEDSSVRDAAVADTRFRDTVGDDLDYIFTPLDGTAMYYTACKMNHSCDPNVIVLYKGRGWGRKHPLAAYCIAYKDIEEGEELTISYIENDDPLQKREKDLANYGFVCHCPKCQAQKSGKLLDGDDGKSEGDSVGELFGAEDEEKEPNCQTQGEVKPLSLTEKVERLDSAVNHSRFENVPPALQGKVSAFVLQIGKDSFTMEEQAILNLWDYCRTGMQERDFCLCKIGGSELEDFLYGKLRKSGWPTTDYRALYWCAGLSAAMGLAHEGSFVDALRYLDKTLILGVSRHHELVSGFFRYVEYHAAGMVNGPYTKRYGFAIPSFTEIEDRKRIEATCLPRPLQFAITEHIGDISNEQFSEQFVSKDIPVVLRSFASTWRSSRNWRTFDVFGGGNGHRLVPIEVGSMIHGQMEEKLVSLRTFVDTFLTKNTDKSCWSFQDSAQGGETVAYMAQHPLADQILSLKSDLDLQPSLCGTSGPSHLYFWLGTGGTRTPLHFDSYENLFVQIVGVKYVRLYGRSETPRLYVNKSGFGLQGNMSDVDCENEDFAKHPLAENATFQEVVLYPGKS